MDGNRDLRVHACALNARDLDALSRQALRSTPCICDGEWVGEGPEGVRRALEKEFAMNDDAIVRVTDVNGVPTVQEFDGGGQPLATFRLVGDAGGRIRELRIDHPATPARAARPVVRWPIDEPGA